MQQIPSPMRHPSRPVEPRLLRRKEPRDVVSQLFLPPAALDQRQDDRSERPPRNAFVGPRIWRGAAGAIQAAVVPRVWVALLREALGPIQRHLVPFGVFVVHLLALSEHLLEPREVPAEHRDHEPLLGDHLSFLALPPVASVRPIRRRRLLLPLCARARLSFLFVRAAGNRGHVFGDPQEFAGPDGAECALDGCFEPRGRGEAEDRRVFLVAQTRGVVLRAEYGE
mmetsp:Transcript_56236/g.132524  ORF Transcript_56236/g.132524 Transcript_56236/m.132524 type:complete len:225 (-) Transcript_56236:844-1518(-)